MFRVFLNIHAMSSFDKISKFYNIPKDLNRYECISNNAESLKKVIINLRFEFVV